MPSQVTVTGSAGPGDTVTALVLTPVSDFQVDTVNKLLNCTVNGQVKTFDISAATVMTVAISGGNFTVVVS